MIETIYDGYVRDGDFVRKGTLSAKVIGTLLKADVPLSARQISLAAGIPRAKVGVCLQQLLFRGWVTRLDKERDSDSHIGFKWELTEKR